MIVLGFFVCRYNNYFIKIPFYLTFKSEENLSQINDSESLNFESLKYNPSDNNEIILLDEACDPESNFYM